MAETVNAAIVGCGGIAEGKHLPALSRQKAARITGFCDLDKTRARKAAAAYGGRDSRVCTDYRELLDDAKLDIVHVCTPNASHMEITVAALEAGKHVMCEKPMAKTAAQARRMLEAAAAAGKKLSISYQNRFHPRSTYLKACCRRGDLGDIYYARAKAIRRRAVPTWGVFFDAEQQGGGALIDIGTHALDLTLWFMDNYSPKYVVGTSYSKLGQEPSAANAWGPWEPQKFAVEDAAFGFVVMADGATVVVEASWALNTLLVGEAQAILCGTRGGADMESGLRLNGEDMGGLYTKTPEFGRGGAAFFTGDLPPAEDLEMQSWLEAVMEDKQPLVLPEQALVVTEILEAIYQSAASGKPVLFGAD